MGMLTERYEKRDVKRFLLLLDMVVAVIFAVALVLLVLNAYKAGFFEGAGLGGEQDARFWAMMGNVAVLTAALAWIMFRFFKDKLADVKSPWA